MKAPFNAQLTCTLLRIQTVQSHCFLIESIEIRDTSKLNRRQLETPATRRNIDPLFPRKPFIEVACLNLCTASRECHCLKSERLAVLLHRAYNRFTDFQVEDGFGEIEISFDSVASVSRATVEFLARQFSR